MRKDITDDEEQIEYIAQWLCKKQLKKAARAAKRKERREGDHEQHRAERAGDRKAHGDQL